MVNVLQDGMWILGIHWEGIALFFIAILGYGSLIVKYAADPGLDASIKWLAALSLGSIVLCVISYFVVFLAHFLPWLLRPGSIAILVFAVFILLRGLRPNELKLPRDIRFPIAGIALFLLLVVRLAFLKHLILPPYSDSPIHYQIVLGFLDPGAAISSKLSLDNILNTYYHFGFHSIVAWLASITAIDPAEAISLLGQLFLVLAPTSVILFTYVVTQDANSALFSGLLAAIGWQMPAFATNWGKFPAVGALAVLPAVLAFPGICAGPERKKPMLLLCGLILLMGIILIHTRIIVCIVLAMLCFFLSGKLQIAEKLGLAQSIRLSILYLLSLWPLASALMNFYRGFPVLIILLVLLPFAFQAHLRLSVGICFYTFGLWLIVIAPTFLSENPRTLLDRQFLEILLYIPFSVLGGAGFAGMLKVLSPRTMLRTLAALVVTAGVIVNFLHSHPIYPDPCCDYFKEGDRLAFQWLRENSSEHTLVIIPYFDDNGKKVGTDASVWIYPLTELNTNQLPFNTNWDSLRTSEEICRTRARNIYIYSGGRVNSFMNAQLLQEKWIAPVFGSGETMIYQVSACPDSPS